MNISYWTGFSKRKNSTKQPTSGTTATVYLKDDTSILNPTFDCTGVPDNVNYIYVSDFGRYYFVDDVTHVGKDRILIKCVSDPMASYKTPIGSYNGFKEYASSSSKVTITDPRNRPTHLIDTTYDSLAFTASHFNTTGCYIIGVLSDQANGDTGVISYYAVQASEMRLFVAEIYSSAFITNIQNQFQAVQDSLVSCIWIPISYSTILPATEVNIYIGRLDAVGKGKKISQRIYTNTTGSVTVAFPSGSGAGNDLKYIDLPPYTSGGLYLPFVGIVPLNIEPLAFTKSISIDYTIDILTGDIVYKVYHGGLWMATYNGNMATKVPVTGASFDGVGVASGALAVIGGAFGTAMAIGSEGGAAPILAGVASMAGGAASAAKSMELQTMINGSTSSAIGAHLGLTPYYYIIQRIPSMTNLTDPQTEQGMPVFKVETTTSGFNKFNNASVSITGFEQEKDAVNDFLNSGFYYE